MVAPARVILLDAGPLGLITNPRLSREGGECMQWLQTEMSRGTCVVIPEIADYEVRRELLRCGKQNGISLLDRLSNVFDYLPLSTQAMRKAAEFWAQARQAGHPTSSDKTIDADMILAAQAVTLGATEFVIATTNVAHLTRFVPAKRWTDLASGGLS